MKWLANECNYSVAYTLSIVGGKQKWLILYKLWDNGIQRYGELKKLESEKLIFRYEYHQLPPKVEYSLTDKSCTLIPILQQMVKQEDDNKPIV